jgi:hypothetical protein
VGLRLGFGWGEGDVFLDSADYEIFDFEWYLPTLVLILGLLYSWSRERFIIIHYRYPALLAYIVEMHTQKTIEKI